MTRLSGRCGANPVWRSVRVWRQGWPEGSPAICCDWLLSFPLRTSGSACCGGRSRRRQTTARQGSLNTTEFASVAFFQHPLSIFNYPRVFCYFSPLRYTAPTVVPFTLHQQLQHYLIRAGHIILAGSRGTTINLWLRSVHLFPLTPRSTPWCAKVIRQTLLCVCRTFCDL